MRPLIDPRLRHGIADHWPSLCTIQEVKVIEESSGQMVEEDGPILVLHVDVPCRLGPLIEGTPTDNERRGVMITSQHARRVLKLNGYYPDIVPGKMEAVIGGNTYPIRGVDSDSEMHYTRLRLEVILPHG